MISKDQIEGKNILLRADLDIPFKNGKIESLYRLQMLIPTLKMCLKYGRHTCLIGHLGRPKDIDSEFSLNPIIEELKTLINQDINELISGFAPGDCWKGEYPLSVRENLRFDKREELLDREFALNLAKGADLYVYEAFAAYRPSSSLSLIPEVLPTTTGLQFDREISFLSSVLDQDAHPSLLLASGAKTDKLSIIQQIIPRFDKFLLGGKFSDTKYLLGDGMDLNEDYTNLILNAIAEAKTVVLNGPLGYFEDGVHSKATQVVFQALKNSQKTTVLGGGDTLAAINTLGFDYNDFTFVSTGGGAMLEFFAEGGHPLSKILAHKK